MEKKRQRRRLYALLMAFFMLVTSVAGNGSLTAYAEDGQEPESTVDLANEGFDSAVLVTSTDGLKKAAQEGKKIVLYSTSAEETLTKEASGKGLAGAKVTPSDGKILISDKAVRMDVEVKAAEGDIPEAYSFSYPSGDKTLYLTSGATGNSLTFEEAASDYSLWNLNQVEENEGTFYVDNVNAKYNNNVQSLEYYNGFTVFGKKETDIYKFQFYAVEETAVGYVIYNAVNKKALSSTASSNVNFLSGVDLEENFKTVKDTEVWKVSEATEEGNVTIATYKDGKKLSMAAEKSYTLLDSVNATWELAEQEDGTYYIINTVRKASGNNHTLEWYASNNYFSTYNPESSGQNADDYKMKLIPVTRSQIEDTQDTEPEPEPEDPVKSTGKYVIYNAANKMALSSNYTSYYNKGVEMESNFTKVVDTEVWEVKTHESGRLTITSMTKKTNLSMDGSNSSTPLGEINDKWEKTEESNGVFYLKNVARNRYLFWSTKYNNFTTSAPESITPEEEANYKLQLLEVQDSQIEETPVEPPREPVMDDGDYFIYSKEAKGVMCYILTGGAANKVAAEPTADKKADFGEGDGTGAAVFHFEWQADTQTYLLKCGSEYLSLDTSNGRTLYRSAKPENTAKNGSYWIIEKNEEFSGYTIKNSTAKSSGADVYLEYYPSSGFCAYTVKDALTSIYVFDFLNAAGVANEDGYVGTKPKPMPLPEAGKSYVVYNESGASIIGGPAEVVDGSARTLGAAVTTKGEDGTFSFGNGGYIFELIKEGDYYLLKNKDKYLVTNAKEELYYMTKEAAEAEKDTEYEAGKKYNTDYKWELTPTEDGLGFTIRSATVKWGSSPILVEYFSGGFSGYTFKAGQPEIFTFQFIECEDEHGFGYVVNPKVIFNSLTEANQDVDFDATFTLDDMGTPTEVKAEVTFEDNSKKTYTPSMDEPKEQGEVVKTGKVTVPKEDLEGHTEMTIVVSAVSKMEGDVNVPYSGTRKSAIHDEPMILSVSPAPNSGTGTDKQPKISVTYANAKAEAEAKLNFNGQEGLAMTEDTAAKTYSYTPAAALEDGKYTAEVTITRKDGKKVSRSWSFYVGEAGYKVKFGQIHSHTAEYSDGSGTLENAYEHAKNNADNMDYLIVTDHSNYFDTTSTASKDSIYDDAAASINKGTGNYPEADPSKNLNQWQEAKATAAYYDKQSSDFVAGFGYEMTWSGGPGHINVFNSKGIVSRNNTDLNNKTNNAGMLAFYDLVVDADEKNATATGNGNISAMFNHPGTTFGFFDSFTGLTADRDKVMNLIEVGNGDGAVGGTGYFPSYEYYDMCLSLGWHVAPTNGQDNHKGGWGSISPTRTVALTETFSEDGIYEAMNQRRIYSTEDQNLTMIYTLDDYPQGSIIENYDKDTVTLNVSLSDEDQEALGKVYVVGEGGKILNEANPEEVSGNTADLTITLDNTSAYYYIKVVQADGDIAVSAPIWVAEAGASKVKVKAAITDVVNEDGSKPVENKATVINSTLTNGEETAVTLVSYSVTVDKKEVKTETVNVSVAAGAEYKINCPWTPEKYGSHEISINYVVKAGDEQYNVTASKNVHVQGENYNTVSKVSDAKAAQEGEEFTVEGILTANTSGYDQDSAFFDCTYVQDETGGINIFPLSGNYQAGQKVRVHGGITYYCGEIELNLSEDYGGYVEILDETPKPVEPAKVSSKDAMDDKNIGLLMQVSGTVSRIHEASDIIDRIYVKDEAGDEACVYINGYIKNSKTKSSKETEYLFGEKGTTVKVGDKVTAVGIGSRDIDELGEVPEGEYLRRLRVRDRAEINVESEEEPPVVEVTEVKLDKSELSLKVAEEVKLNATVLPEGAVNSELTWTSSDEAVATVTKEGLVKGIKAGEATITAQTANGTKAECKVTVTQETTGDKTEPAEVRLNTGALSIKIGAAAQLTATVLPAGADSTLTWTSSNAAVATVTNTGLVKGVKAGTSTITVKTVNGKTASCQVTVTAPAPVKVAVKSVGLNKTKLTLGVKETFKLTATVKPSNATNKKVTWKTSKKSVVTVKNGKITAKKKGTATITATADGKKKTCKVTVKAAPKKIQKLNKTKVTIKRKKTFKIKVTLPKNTASNKITYSVKNKKIATVSSKGVITGKKKGKTTVTVKTFNGKKKTIKVTVK